MLARFFIARPVLANVLAILTVLLGLFALLKLPVAQYPNVVPPTVQVTTRYPGASPSDVLRSVALPIEQQVNGVQSMLYMQSTSAADGAYTLTVTFAIGADLDQAQVLVQNRVQSVIASLPQAVQAQGVSVQKRSTAILQIVALTSADPRHDSLYLSNYAIINMRDVLARVPGVGSINVFGAGQYAMRVWLDPERLRARGLTVQDVTQDLQQQNMDVTAGQFGMSPAPADQARQYTLVVAGRLSEVSDFENVVLKVSEGALTRLRDVGRVELGAQSYGQAFTLDGRPAAGLAVFQSPDANALAVATAVRATLKELQRGFPVGVTASVPFDSTVFVSASVDEVYWTLIEAAVLTLLVVVLFLQDWRAMLAPATTVPVTIIGAFAAMAIFGFSINLSTLFAIVLAVGIVVDDAIVVVERAAYFLARGLERREAAATALDELLGPIIGITLVLMAVFIPASFLSGLSGRLYAQFALVIASTAAISAINAATLKPVQCATWLRPPRVGRRPALPYRWFDRVFGALERRYVAAASLLARHAGIATAAALLLVAASIAGFARIPTGFLPLEDQGYFVVMVQLPPGAALGRTEQALQRVQEKARTLGFVRDVIGIAGVSPLDGNAPLSSSGVAYVMLKDWAQRRGADGDLRSLYDRISDTLTGIEGARTLVIVPPAIQGLGNVGGFTMMVELRDGSTDFAARLQSLVNGIVSTAAKDTGLQRVASPFGADAPQVRLDVDRAKAESLGVSVGDVFQALSTAFGSSYVGQIIRFGRVFQVYAQADQDFRMTARALSQIAVRGAGGAMVPVDAVVSAQPSAGPPLITSYNLYPAATIIGAPAPGRSSSEAMAAMGRIVRDALPPGAGFDWTAMSYQEQVAGNQLVFAFGAALILVYLVLAAQYESWILPLAVVLGVPLAFVGPALVMGILGVDNNLYTQIGLVLLVALAAKNAILIVEFALEARRFRGVDIVQAAVDAAQTRFRPIVMTSLAFGLGVLPLILAHGAGANARRSIGIAVFTGMLSATCIGTLVVPALFVVTQRLSERFGKHGQLFPSRLVRAAPVHETHLSMSKGEQP